uniref:Uncharacterized protein n=1 Tax=Oryza punctata TaxID=4537 RepID=A0A0E0KNF4_ORYPU
MRGGGDGPHRGRQKGVNGGEEEEHGKIGGSGEEEKLAHMEEEWPYPLLSKEIDARHRAKKISDGNSCFTLAVLIPRTVGWGGIDPRWKPRPSYLRSDDADKDVLRC